MDRFRASLADDLALQASPCNPTSPNPARNPQQAPKQPIPASSLDTASQRSESESNVSFSSVQCDRDEPDLSLEEALMFQPNQHLPVDLRISNNCLSGASNMEANFETILALQKLIQRRRELKAIDRQLFTVIAQYLFQLDDSEQHSSNWPLPAPTLFGGNQQPVSGPRCSSVPALSLLPIDGAQLPVYGPTRAYGAESEQVIDLSLANSRSYDAEECRPSTREGKELRPTAIRAQGASMNWRKSRLLEGVNLNGADDFQEANSRRKDEHRNEDVFGTPEFQDFDPAILSEPSTQSLDTQRHLSDPQLSQRPLRDSLSLLRPQKRYKLEEQAIDEHQLAINDLIASNDGFQPAVPLNMQPRPSTSAQQSASPMTLVPPGCFNSAAHMMSSNLQQQPVESLLSIDPDRVAMLVAGSAPETSDGLTGSMLGSSRRSASQIMALSDPPRLHNSCPEDHHSMSMVSNPMFNEQANTLELVRTAIGKDQRKKIAFRCHVCGSGFEDKHRLQQHLSIHLNLHPSWFEERTITETMAQYESKRGDYLCTQCSIRFDTTTEFDKHMQLHADKPHRCELCERDNKRVSFRYYRQLLTHLRSHCFLYSCRFAPNCKQTANRKDYLKLHILKHHLNNKLPEHYTISCH